MFHYTTRRYWKTFFLGVSPLKSRNNQRQIRNFRSWFILYRQFSLYLKKRSQSKKSNGRDPELKKWLHAKKVKKCCIRCKKLTCWRFTLNKKFVYLSLTCGKQIIIKPVWRDMLSSGTPGFCKSFFRNCRYPLWTSLTVLSKLMYGITFLKSY